MPAKVGVKASEGGDGAPAPGEIAEVDMGKGDCVWTEVEGAGSEDAAHKVPAQGRLPGEQEAHLYLIECEQQRGPHREED